MRRFCVAIFAVVLVVILIPRTTLAAPDLTDSDKDGLPDRWELAIGTDATKVDSDGDGYKDGTEVINDYDPLNAKPVRIEKTIRVDDKKLNLKFEFGGKLLMEIPVSTGKKSTPTPKGEFTVLTKVPVKHYGGPTWDYPNTKWNLQFTAKNGLRYYIHGAYWHDKFGVAPVSGGCVNVRYEDMETLYNWTPLGAKVIVS